APSLLVFYRVFFTLVDYAYTLVKRRVKFSTLGNIVGHLPAVVLGITMAHFRFISFRKSTLFLAFVVFIGSQLHVTLFPLGFLAVSILLIQGVSYLNRISPTKFKNVILYVGQI